MKWPFLSLVVALVLLLAPAAVFAKHVTIGIYAVIDDVTFERDSVRISGVFVVPVPMSSGNYRTPQRGYLYFRIRPEMEQATRKDWNELKKVARTGQVVGFAQYWVPNPDDPSGNPHHSLEVTVHTDNEVAAPELYPLSHHKGILQHGNEGDPAFEKIAAQLQEASHR